MDALYRFCAVLFVLGLLGLLWLFAKRMNAGSNRLRFPWPRSKMPGKLWGGSDKPLDVAVLQRVHLTGSHQLHLVRTGDQRVLICTYPQGCTLLMTEHSTKQQEITPSDLEMFAYARNAR
jgi:hypothetical protein